ncbi:MAG TPA: hypothetical protein ENK57_04805 [Polyangiaceae bacterium]|nr:hypothetical protein [Polyangiaceae bacterium]
MRELRFHRDLYRGECVDEAIKVYGPYAAITPLEDDGYWVVQIESSSVARERKIADELANYALGLTIRTRGA